MSGTHAVQSNSVVKLNLQVQAGVHADLHVLNGRPEDAILHGIHGLDCLI